MSHFEDPLLSRMQAALDQVTPGNAVADPHMQELLAAAQPLAQARELAAQGKGDDDLHRMADAFKPRSCAEIYIKLALTHLYGDPADLERLKQEFRFSMCDLRWTEAMERYLAIYHAHGRHHRIPYVRWQSLSDFVYDDFPDDMRVGVLGDWGTGSDLAMGVLERMMAMQPDLVIHLGDVYYAGEESEFRRKLLDPMRRLAVKPDGSPVPVFSMSGNHDMYSGGDPYYAAIRQLNADPARQQQASYFCLRTKNRKWQVLAGDTGLHDHDPFKVISVTTFLDPQEVTWHVDKVQGIARSGGRTLFMTHHQPFSAYIPVGSAARKKPSEYYQNPRLLEDFRAISAAGEVPLWLWGHEHNLAIYQPYAGIQRGRCAGHSSVPVLPAQMDPYKLRHCSKIERDLFLWGLARGRWGRHLWDEWRAFRQLQSRDPAFPVPQLVTGPGGEVKLPLAPERNVENQRLPAMYEHGFTMLQFGLGADGEQVRADYHGAGREPLWSETF